MKTLWTGLDNLKSSLNKYPESDGLKSGAAQQPHVADATSSIFSEGVLCTLSHWVSVGFAGAANAGGVICFL